MADIYAQIDVDLPWHEKLRALPVAVAPAALGLYSAGLCHCQKNLTDGIIFRGQIAALMPIRPADAKKLTQALCDARLWEDCGDYILVHDYLDWNKSRSQIEEIRERRRSAGSKGGRTRATASQANAQASATANAQAESKQAASKTEARPYPTTTTTTDTATTPGCDGFSGCKDKPLSFDAGETGVPGSVLGYWSDKTGRDPDAAELRSLRILCRSYPAHVVNMAIGQCVVQGNPPTNFALVTAIAKAEAGVAS